MAKLYVTEYRFAPDGLQVAKMPPVAEQVVDYSGGVAASAAFSNATGFVRVHTDAICSIKFGANPTATTSSARLAADATEYFRVNAGDKVSAITNT